MKALATTVLLALLATLLATAAATAAEGPRLEDPATGQAVTLKAGGKGLHVVFFATWCPDCVAELPRLAEIEDAWRANGYELVIVAVSARHDRQRLIQFAAERRLPGRLLFDASDQAQRKWEPVGLPAHVLLDREGRVAARAERLDRPFEQAIEKLLAGDPR